MYAIWEFIGKGDIIPILNCSNMIIRINNSKLIINFHIYEE